jgi:hypothetical protein
MPFPIRSTEVDLQKSGRSSRLGRGRRPYQNETRGRVTKVRVAKAGIEKVGDKSKAQMVCRTILIFYGVTMLTSSNSYWLVWMRTWATVGVLSLDESNSAFLCRSIISFTYSIEIISKSDCCHCVILWIWSDVLIPMVFLLDLGVS